MMEKRLSKLDLIIKEIPKTDQINIEFENLTKGKIEKLFIVLSWGSTKGAILDSLEKISGLNQQIQFLYLQIKLLYPFPGNLLEDIINDRIEKIKKDKQVSELKIILTTVEMNYLSQLESLIKQYTTLKPNHRILKYNGRPISHTELYNSFKELINQRNNQRVILDNGV